MGTPQSITPSLVPTTEEDDYPRFRLLIVGRSGVGKSSLINAFFKVSLADVQHDRASGANINEGITSPFNKHLILHDSQGYEPGDKNKFDILEKFISEQTKKQSPSERLHAIWLCIPAPYASGRVIETGEEKIFKLNRNKVPIIVVITKFDLFIAGVSKRNRMRGSDSTQLAEQTFKKTFGPKFEKGGVSRDRATPYALVSCHKSHSDTLRQLVNITMDSIGVEASSPSAGLSRGLDENQLRWVKMALAMAQRVDMAGKLETSIKMGRKKYWGSETAFLSINPENCLNAIHTDIIMICNFQGLHEFLLSDPFRRRMMVLVEDFKDSNTMQSKVTVASALTKLWTKAVYKNEPEHIRFLMGYIIDLMLILQAMFQVSLQDPLGRVTINHVDEIIYEFHCSGRKEDIHEEIWSFVKAHDTFTKVNVVEKIRSMLKEDKIDTQLSKDRPALRSLLIILRLELTANGLVVNQTILNVVCKLLGPEHFHDIVSELHSLDVDLLLDYILYLLRNGNLSTCGIPDATRKARRLLVKLVDEMNIVPKNLYINIADTRFDIDPIDVGGFALVFKGEHSGQQVVLKLLDQGHKNPRKDFCREALAWGSLAHRFILPLIGIFEKKSFQFLVSPYMKNGTLTQWRRSQPTAIVAEIHRLMLEVAEGVQHLHSEGIVHGNLHGENIFLDSSFHCRISDIGLTWSSSATSLSVLSFSAPELFTICNKCTQFDCDGCYSNHGVQRKKTMEMDVYAFGCLIYATFFGTMPLDDKNTLHIPWLITHGVRPARLNSPVMDDGIWKLIEKCWIHNPSERPTMKQIVETYVSFLATLPSLIKTLRELTALHQFIVNDLTYRLMCRLLEQYKSNTIASELATTEDVELFLDFTLQLLYHGNLSNSGIQHASKKARSLMFKLMEDRCIIPKCLFISGIKTEMALEVFGIEHSIFQGKHEGNQVMLQAVYKGLNYDALLKKRFYQEALTWKSLSHPFIIPLLGIFEDKLQLCLVSPFMMHGTLTHWRRGQELVNEDNMHVMHRLMLEVAEGMQYIHSEGIVHGDLRGENIFLDAKFHCQISNIGLTQQHATTSVMVNFAAPELFRGTSNPFESGGHFDDYILMGEKTIQTDVYEFGCLCYAILFNTLPFKGKGVFEIRQLIANGKHPDRLSHPKVDDNVWNVIDYCWATNPSKRPTMDQIVQTGMRFTSIPLLLANLRGLNELGSSLVNENTIGFIHEPLDDLDLSGLDVNRTESKRESDVELLLNFVTDLLRSGHLMNEPIQGANKKARRLMFKLIDMTKEIPRSLLITNVTNLEGIGVGGFGRVFKGLYGGKHVAVKELYNVFHQNTLLKDLCREALVWRSLSHRFIIPLLGIYEGKSELSLVSEFMPNGTLTEWRKGREMDVDEIHRLILEVAEGVRYLHSEGIVHGDLHGGNVLLDSEFHCQITDFGLTRHAEASVATSTRTFLPNFAAPELFGMCTECSQQDCEGCNSGDDVQHKSKTTKTDVYAFGCLYYAIFFDTVPFQGSSDLLIMRRIIAGARPDRLQNPSMDDNSWNVIQTCWSSKPSERPTMEQVVEKLTLLAQRQNQEITSDDEGI